MRWSYLVAALVLAGPLFALAEAGAQPRQPYSGDLIFESQELLDHGTRQPPDAARRRSLEAQLERFTSPTLRRFSGDEEFARYAGLVIALERAGYGWFGSRGGKAGVRFAQASGSPDVRSDAVEPVCAEDDPLCFAAPDVELREITVTGSRVQPSNPSITNNQMRSVEEGDIVKQIGDHLLVLQDGRIFVVGIGARGRRLALTDRADVYRDPKSDMWYDEMLVFGDRILVAGYSYDDEETELAIFQLSPRGRLTREGVFRASSDDYYSSNNYATRLIGDTLVVYTPLEVRSLAGSELRWPVVRRWQSEEPRADGQLRRREGRPLLDASSIYRPVRTTLAPVVNTVSFCPLGRGAELARLECRTTAVAGPWADQWYVTETDVYLWIGDEWDRYRDQPECGSGAPSLDDARGALLYRIPVDGSSPTLLGVRGSPPDQFAMQAMGGRFHALVQLPSTICDQGDQPTALRLFTTRLAGLSATLAEAPPGAYSPLPPVPGRFVASRFTDRHLVYGGLSSFRRGLPDLSDYDTEETWAKRARAEPLQPAYALSIDRPRDVRPLDIRHSVIRAERVGDDIVLTGYRDHGGLLLSYLDLGATPSIASQVRLAGRYESEGRSHAFNSLVETGGGGLMGLPTVLRIDDSRREYWRSSASDLSYLKFDSKGRVAPIGELSRRFDYVDQDEKGEDDEDGIPGYKCEVSCIDWYGNSRPIFTGGRIFGLSGTELIEGRIEGGSIREVQRINIALSPLPR